MANFTFNIGKTHFEKITIEELKKVLCQEETQIGKTQSVAKS
ncbi:hypothetical protein [Lactiplantibacillus pentosus]|nr:hypothetical protein [Lactiplantibacillus pentosus]